MFADFLTSNIPILIIMCLIVYIVYFLNKRVKRLETVFKKVNEINNSLVQILERSGVNPQEVIQSDLSQVQGHPPGQIVEQSQEAPQKEEGGLFSGMASNPFFSALSGLFGGMSQQAEQQTPILEEINDLEEKDEQEQEHHHPNDVKSVEAEEIPVEIKQHYHEESTVNSDEESHAESEEESQDDISENSAEDKKYTEDDLSKMNVKELHEIAAKHSIVFSKKNESGKQVQKTKKELITDILAVVAN
jgi:hypothetical protein